MDDRSKMEAFLKADFVPIGSHTPIENRVATALEYIAYHLGQIDKKMDRVIENIGQLNPP